MGRLIIIFKIFISRFFYFILHTFFVFWPVIWKGFISCFIFICFPNKKLSVAYLQLELTPSAYISKASGSMAFGTWALWVPLCYSTAFLIINSHKKHPQLQVLSKTFSRFYPINLVIIQIAKIDFKGKIKPVFGF